MTFGTCKYYMSTSLKTAAIKNRVNIRSSESRYKDKETADDDRLNFFVQKGKGNHQVST